MSTNLVAALNTAFLFGIVILIFAAGLFPIIGIVMAFGGVVVVGVIAFKIMKRDLENERKGS